MIRIIPFWDRYFILKDVIRCRRKLTRTISFQWLFLSLFSRIENDDLSACCCLGSTSSFRGDLWWGLSHCKVNPMLGRRSKEESWKDFQPLSVFYHSSVCGFTRNFAFSFLRHKIQMQISVMPPFVGTSGLFFRFLHSFFPNMWALRLCSLAWTLINFNWAIGRRNSIGRAEK